MYRVLLVDDEILIRERIAKKVPWEELGYSFVSSCSNGKEAVEILEKESIDLVLTDVRMPYMDGIELARYIYENHSQIQVVIISGYDDFSYAKQAITYKVLSYILKPVTAKNLIEELKNIKKTLEEKQASLQVQSNYKNSYDVLKNQFVIELLQGSLGKEVILQKCEEFNIQLGIAYYQVIRGCLKQFGESNNLLSCIPVIETCIDQDTLLCIGTQKDIFLIVKGDNEDILYKKVNEYHNEIREQIEIQLGFEWISFLGNEVKQVEELVVSYNQVLELKEFIYLERKDRIYSWNSWQRAKRTIDYSVVNINMEEKTIDGIKKNQRESVYKEIRSVRDQYVANWVRKSHIVIKYQQIILAIMNLLEDIHITDDGITQQEKNLMSKLFECEYISDMEAELFRFVDKVMEVMNSSRINYGESQAIAAVDYINENYGNHELSLQLICDELTISVSYFSTIFKQHTGMTFIEALTKKRMEKAEQFLVNTSLKTYEIAEMCGYQDANYFSSTFKRYYGVAPKKIRKGTGIG